VLHCADCGWKSACPHCSAWRVFHKIDRSLRCHHCGLAERVPSACPECGNLDIAPIGRGTERLEEQLAELLGRPEQRPARIARIDADSTRRQGRARRPARRGACRRRRRAGRHADDHEGPRLSAASRWSPPSTPTPRCSAATFARPERLFALLMQAAGRAGRDASQSGRSEMWVQTWHPTHPLYQALTRHDFAAFAASQLAEREAAGLPPFSHLAMLRAEARTQAGARAFPRRRRTVRGRVARGGAVTVYPAVPTSIARVADVERMQMLIESPSRAALQRFLARWLPDLHILRRANRAKRASCAGPSTSIRWRSDAGVSAHCGKTIARTASPASCRSARRSEQDHLRAAEQRHLLAVRAEHRRRPHMGRAAEVISPTFGADDAFLRGA
jgi:primosomal protein N' (replication factor Y)